MTIVRLQPKKGWSYMDGRNFQQLLRNQWARGNFVCVGLDSELTKIPESVRRCAGINGTEITNTIYAFNSEIIKATKDLVCAYKPNIAFYEAYGTYGISALLRTINFVNFVAPEVPVILDAKRADIGNSNGAYARAVFDTLGADAITVNPYFGEEALEPFLTRIDKGIFVLCRTSNPGAEEFQDLSVNGEPLYYFISRSVANKWNKNGNCALVVGATHTDELYEIRKLVGEMPILVPGIGAQGGNLEKTICAGMDNNRQGLIINSSSGIIFASSGIDFAQAARHETEKLHNLINSYIKEG